MMCAGKYLFLFKTETIMRNDCYEFFRIFNRTFIVSLYTTIMPNHRNRCSFLGSKKKNPRGRKPTISQVV